MKYKRTLSFVAALAIVVLNVFMQERSFESDANQVQQINHIEKHVA